MTSQKSIDKQRMTPCVYYDSKSSLISQLLGQKLFWRNIYITLLLVLKRKSSACLIISSVFTKQVKTFQNFLLLFSDCFILRKNIFYCHLYIRGVVVCISVKIYLKFLVQAKSQQCEREQTFEYFLKKVIVSFRRIIFLKLRQKKFYHIAYW